MKDAFDGKHYIEGVIGERYLTSVALDKPATITASGANVHFSALELPMVDIQSGESQPAKALVEACDCTAEAAAYVEYTLAIGDGGGVTNSASKRFGCPHQACGRSIRIAR